jgi:hypothetical protein
MYEFQTGYLALSGLDLGYGRSGDTQSVRDLLLRLAYSFSSNRQSAGQFGLR